MRGGVNTSTFTNQPSGVMDVTVIISLTHTHLPTSWPTGVENAPNPKNDITNSTLSRQSSAARLLYCTPIANNATAPVTVTRTSKLSVVSVPNLRGFSEWDCIENKHGERRECECSDGSLKDSEPGGAERKEEVRRLVEFCDETNLMVYLESESAFYLMHTCTRCFATCVATWLVLFS